MSTQGMMVPKDAYTRVGVPGLPVRINELPNVVQQLARAVPLPEIDFARDGSVQVIDHLACAAWLMPELSHEDTTEA